MSPALRLAFVLVYLTALAVGIDAMTGDHLLYALGGLV